MTPLHEQLRELADDLSQDPRRLLIEAADRLELVEGLYEDQVEITRNWKLAADARWDRIKRLEDRIDLLEACNADVARIAEERNEALKRIRQLEKAGDGMVRWIENYGCKHEFYPAIEIWTAAKEAKP